MKVALATRYQVDADELARAFPEVEFIEVASDGEVPPLPDVEACLGGNDPRRFAAILRAAPRLRWYHTVSAGVDGMMIPEYLERSGLVLTNNTGSYDAPIAEHVIAMIFAAAKRLHEHLADQRAHRWRGGASEHSDVRGATLVVLGLGSIGGEVARLARGVGMRVVGVRRSGGTHPAAERVVTPAELAAAAREADYLVVTAALTPQTRGIVSREVIAALKPSAWVVNIARGPIVDEAALLDALRAKRIGGAAIDAWWQEPLPADSPWWDLDNVIVTPHRSYSSPRVRPDTLHLFGENLRRFRSGEPLLNVVDRRAGY